MDVKYAGIDWLTMTTKNERVGMQWWNTYAKYRKQKSLEGDKPKPFHNGYYAGEITAAMRWGWSKQIGYIVVVSGRDAERLYQRLQPGKSKVTRLDLCIDFLFDSPMDLAGLLYKMKKSQSYNRQRKFSLFVNSSEGATFYLGSRQSMQFGRVYDKGVESKKESPGKLWRAEVEYKKPLSGLISKRLASAKADDRELAICDTVCLWFADRGAELFPRGKVPNAIHVSVEQCITTAERKLAWLRSQVAPSVQELISAGYGKMVLDSLLLDVETVSECLQEQS